LREEFAAAYQELFDEPGLTAIREGAGRLDITLLNIIGVDASALGNHEFDLGTATVSALIDEEFTTPTVGLGNVRYLGAQFPYLSANLDFSADPNLASRFTNQILPNTAYDADLSNLTATRNAPRIAPATIIEQGGEQIGVVGATTQVLASISSPGGVTVIGPDAMIWRLSLASCSQLSISSSHKASIKSF